MSPHEGYCAGPGCAACSHRVTGDLKACESVSCGYLPDCAGSRPAMSALAERKLRAIEDGTIHDCCYPDNETMLRLEASAGRQASMYRSPRR